MKKTLAATLLAAVSCVLAPLAAAQDFPNRPIRVITGAAPGSSGDVLARVLGEHLSANVWKQAAVIDNRPGAGGAIASQAVLQAPADGYTVFVAAGSYLTITPATTANLAYDVDKDFTPLAFIAEVPLVLGARPDLPYKTLQELIAYAKSNPGKVTYAANTPGTFPNLATEYFSERAGIKMHYIPYKGSAPALQDLFGGRLDLVVEGAGALGGAIKGGQLRPLAVTSERRDPTLPNVPAIAEAIPGFSAVGFFAVMGNARMPQAITAKLSEDFRGALARPEVGKRFADMGMYVQPMTPQELGAFIKKEREIWGGVVRRMGFAPK